MRRNKELIAAAFYQDSGCVNCILVVFSCLLTLFVFIKVFASACV